MGRRTAVLLVFASLASPVGSIASISAQNRPPNDPTDVTLGTTEVRLDVVARDRRGHAITNLAADDVTVLEDGVRQEVTSFRLVRPSSAPTQATSPTPGGTTTQTGIDAAGERSLTSAPEDTRAVAIVFDSLTPDARALAYKGAKQYIEENFQPGDAVGVFVTDLALANIQPYTTDKQAVLKGIETASGRAGASFTSQRNQLDRARGVTSGVPSTDVEATFTAPGSGGGDRESILLRQLQRRTAEGFQSLQNIQQGYSTTNALLAVVNGLSLLPGRKALLFFSQGVVLPPQVRRQFDAVVSSANQARVSIYAIDASGLRVDGARNATASAIIGYGNERMNELGTPGEGGGGSMLGRFEDLENSLISGGTASLERLSKQTGGYFVGDTNGIGNRLRVVDSDLRTYYEVSYSPTNPNYDGSFRHVAVSVHRTGARVSTREGYYAINVTNAPPVLPYEAPAVAAATAKVLRKDFQVRSLATSFPEPGRPGLAPVIVSVPASSATFMQSAKKKTFSTAFSIVVLARNASGQIVGKTSKEYVLTGPLEKMETTRQGNLLFYAELDLEPGRYTVDAVAYDAPTRKASVRQMPLVVPDAPLEGPRLSSLTIVDRAEDVSKTPSVDNKPFRVGDALLYPNLGTPLRKSADAKLAFFVTAYVAKGEVKPPEATVELAQNGVSLKDLPVELPPPDADGRIQYTNAFPIDGFPPGTYDLKVTVSDGEHTTSRNVRFTIGA